MNTYYEKYKKSLDLLVSEKNEEREELTYNHAVHFVQTTGQVSISKLQRALRIGYNPAARTVERMERNGIVSKPERDGGRSVLLFGDE